MGPRNLPSTGFFPFLQTLMCNTDSTCHNKSRLVDPSASRSSRRSTRSARYCCPSVHTVYELLSDLCYRCSYNGVCPVFVVFVVVLPSLSQTYGMSLLARYRVIKQKRKSVRTPLGHKGGTHLGVAASHETMSQCDHGNEQTTDIPLW